MQQLIIWLFCAKPTIPPHCDNTCEDPLFLPPILVTVDLLKQLLIIESFATPTIPPTECIPPVLKLPDSIPKLIILAFFILEKNPTLLLTILTVTLHITFPCPSNTDVKGQLLVPIGVKVSFPLLLGSL